VWPELLFCCLGQRWRPDRGPEDADPEQPGPEQLGPQVLPQPLRTIAKLSAALFARPPAESVRDTLTVMDSQPTDRLILRAVGKPVDPSLSTFDPGEARRLYDLTARLI
jgi:hypothetical protein